MERRRSCAPRGNGTLERHGAGRRSKREPGRAGGVKFEPEVVPPEPAETGRPEAETMRPNGERTHTAKRTGGQSAEAEPARSGRKAGPAGEGRRGGGGSGGRAERKQVARKEAEQKSSRRAICPRSGRRRLAVEPAERRLPAGVNGQVARRWNRSEPAPVRAGGAE